MYLRKTICFFIIIYKKIISPCFTPCCRFYPSCSQYALDAINYYGIFKGLALSFYRILRCQPWAKGGYDPVIYNKNLPR